MKNFRDVEQLSLYLDGRLSPAETARIESRLSSDPELVSAFDDLRFTRSLLRKLPSRKAPRNFTLTRQMVGLKPSLPRSYSFFRFSTAFATLLLTFTFAANALSQVPLLGAAYAGAYGMGGGGEVAEAPAATEAPAAMLEEAFVAPAPAAESMAPLPTAGADTAAAAEAPTAKEAAPPSEAFDQPPAPNQAAAEAIPMEAPQPQPKPVSPAWQAALFVLILFSGLAAFLSRRAAIQKWK